MHWSISDKQGSDFFTSVFATGRSGIHKMILPILKTSKSAPKKSSTGITKILTQTLLKVT